VNSEIVVIDVPKLPALQVWVCYTTTMAKIRHERLEAFLDERNKLVEYRRYLVA
jgi:hypothetical protein